MIQINNLSRYQEPMTRKKTAPYLPEKVRRFINFSRQVRRLFEGGIYLKVERDKELY